MKGIRERCRCKYAGMRHMIVSIFYRHGGLTGAARHVAAKIRQLGLLGAVRRLWGSEAPVSKSIAPAWPVTGIDARVAAYKKGEVFSERPVRAVHLYVAAKGNHFFLEIAELIRCGFADIGVRADVVLAERLEDCSGPERAQADVHWIIAPHELFHFIPQAAEWPRSNAPLWMLNTEQAHTTWFSGARAALDTADLVLDMDWSMTERLQGMGLRAEHLPLGFSPSCRLFDGLAPVERNLATQGIPSRIRDWADRDDPLATPLRERPLDCCFFGNSVARRTKFFARNAALFAELNAYLRLLPLKEPLRCGVTTPLSTQGTSSIVRRSKVALNIHQSEHRYFEWHRIVLQGIRQGALVLSEPCTAGWPFRPNRDYITVELEHMAETLEYLLRSADGRELAERVRRQGYTTLTTRCGMGERLQELLTLYAGVGEKP